MNRIRRPQDLVEQLERSLRAIPYPYSTQERVEVANAMANGVVSLLHLLLAEHMLSAEESVRLGDAALGWVRGKQRATVEARLVGRVG